MPDGEVDRVFEYILALDPDGTRFDAVVRGTYDQLYDGPRSGRYSWDQLYKTERTHFGTLVEINAQREFEFADGAVMDYSIVGVEVDCKYSHTGQWMMPPEVLGHVCLVLTASDDKSFFSAGLVRALPDLLNTGHNRDAKVTLNEAGRAAIMWLYQRHDLTENLLLHLSDGLRHEILERYAGPGNGQRRVNALFRLVQQHVITRTVVATVAQQQDYMKRVRMDGGARSHLRSEGIIILGDYKAHRLVAKALEVPEPVAGGFVSVRVVPDDGPPSAGQAVLDGRAWRVAGPDDPVVEAPLLPSTRSSGSSS
jgi:hypothetical protein